MSRKHKRCRRSKNNSQFTPETQQTKDSKLFEATTLKVKSSIAEPSLPGPSGIAHKFQSSVDPKSLNAEIGEACCLPIDDKTQDFQSSKDPKALDDEIGEACCLPIEDKTDDEASLYTECHSNPTQSPVPPDYGTPFMCYSPTEDVVDVFYDFPLKAPPDTESFKSRQDQPLHNSNEEQSNSSHFSSSSITSDTSPAETKPFEHGGIQPTAKDDTISQEESNKMVIPDETRPCEPVTVQTTNNDQEHKGAKPKVTEGQGNTKSDKLEESAPVCDDRLFHEETEAIEPTMQYEEVLAASGSTIANTFLLEKTEICPVKISINKCTTDDKMLSLQDCSNLDLQNTEVCELKQQYITDVTDDLASGAELIIIAPSDLITSDLKLLKVAETPQDAIKIDQCVDDVQEEKADIEDLQGVSRVEINITQPTNDHGDANTPSLHIKEANSEPVGDTTAEHSNLEVAHGSRAISPQEVSAPEVLHGDGSPEAVDRSTPEQIGGFPNATGTSRGKKRKHKETRRKKHGSGVRKLDKCDEIDDTGMNERVVDTISTNTTPLMENQNNEYAEYSAAISGIEHLSVSDEKYIAEPSSVEQNKPNSGIDYAKYYAAFHEEEYTLNYDDSMPTVSHYVKPPRRPLKIEAPPKEDKKAEKCPDKSAALDEAIVDTDSIQTNEDNSPVDVPDKSDVIPIAKDLPLMHPLSVCPIFLRLPEIARRQKYPVYTTLPIGVCDTCYSSKSALTRMRYTNKNMHRMMKVPGVGAYNRLVFAGNKDDLSYVDTKKNPIPASVMDDDVTETVGMDNHWDGDQQYVPAPLTRVPRPMPPLFLPPVLYGRPYMPFPRMFPLPYPYVPYPYVRFNYPPPIPLFIPPQAFPRPPVFRPPLGPPSFFNIPPYPQNIFFPRESQNALANRPKMTQNASVRRPETGARPKTFKNSNAKPKTPKAEKQRESPKSAVLGEFWIRTDKPPNTIPPFGNTKSPTAVDEGDIPDEPVRSNSPEADRTPSRRKKHHGRRKKSRRFTEVVSPAQVSVPGYESIPLGTQMTQQPQFVMPYREMVEDSRDDYYFSQDRNDHLALPPVYEDEIERSDYIPEEEEIEDDLRAADEAGNSASGLSTSSDNIPDYSQGPATNIEPQKPCSM